MALKRRDPRMKIIAVEPETSAVISGKAAGPHKIQGLGAGFIPAILEREWIDEVLTVSYGKAFETARQLAKYVWLPGGLSTGANVAAAITVASRTEMADKTVVTFVAIFG